MPALESRSRSSSPYAIEQTAVTIQRSALGVWWRWRSELGYLATASGGFLECWHCIGLDATGVALGVPAALAAALPWPRRFLAARFWSLFTRHRLQRSFWELRLHTRAGILPPVVWISGSPVGTRAWVLLRAGMTFEDFEDSAPAFAVACNALDCRVTAPTRWSSLICIDIIRRDALGPSRVVRSPLADLPALEPFPDFVPEPATEAVKPPAWPGPALAED
jgi:hypothetical protein